MAWKDDGEVVFLKTHISQVIVRLANATFAKSHNQVRRDEIDAYVWQLLDVVDDDNSVMSIVINDAIKICLVFMLCNTNPTF